MGRVQQAPAAPRGEVIAMLVGDIEGSTALVERLGDQTWLHVLRAHRATVATTLADAGVADLRTWGDGFLALFSTVEQGLDGAIALHRRLRAGPLAVRLGFHSGVVHRLPDDDIVGIDVHVATRVAAQAAGGELLLSEAIRPAARRRTDVRTGPARLALLPGLSKPRPLYPVELF